MSTTRNVTSCPRVVLPDSHLGPTVRPDQRLDRRDPVSLCLLHKVRTVRDFRDVLAGWTLGDNRWRRELVQTGPFLSVTSGKSRGLYSCEELSPEVTGPLEVRRT